MIDAEPHPRAIQQSCRTIAWRHDTARPASRVLAEETAVAISYNGSTHAVLMATPADLEDLAVGFSLTEGVIAGVHEIENIAIETFEIGLDVQVRVAGDLAARLAARRRSMVGPVGCGLCGIESLEAAVRPLRPVAAGTRFTPDAIAAAVDALAAHQPLNRATAATHAAAFFAPDGRILVAREDVGRHNALDKLIGALACAGIPAASGGIALTSRVSVELVQKAAAVGCGLLAAVSAPSALAVRSAAAARVTIAAVVRGASFETFTGADRIIEKAVADVA